MSWERPPGGARTREELRSVTKLPAASGEGGGQVEELAQLGRGPLPPRHSSASVASGGKRRQGQAD